MVRDEHGGEEQGNGSSAAQMARRLGHDGDHRNQKNHAQLVGQPSPVVIGDAAEDGPHAIGERGIQRDLRGAENTSREAVHLGGGDHAQRRNQQLEDAVQRN